MKGMYVLLCLLFGSVAGWADNLRLWYSKPATEWTEALPLGNSRLGVMVYGGVEKEELQLNEETVWAGGPHRNDNPQALEALPEIRRLVFEGKSREAQDLVGKSFETPRNGMPYQTIGSLLLDFPIHDSVSCYRRELDIERAVATVCYKMNGVNYRRELFTSMADDVVVLRLTADHPASISFHASFQSPLVHKIKEWRGRLVLSAVGQEHEGVPGVIREETQLGAVNEGGRVKVENGILKVEKADAVTLYLSSATNFVNYKNVTGDAHKRAGNLLEAACKIPYEVAREKHTALYRKQFDRVSLDLGFSERDTLETDVRIARFADGKDPALAVLLFQYGRYLLISSSQPGGQPANLQGIWNKDLLAPWDGKYTVNINLQMNYWPAEVTNLSECHLPLVQMLKELSESGHQTARTMYGCRGWVLHHNTDLWRCTGLVDKAFWGMWPNGGAWLCQHLWEHYLYTGDKEFLNEVYPVLKGASDFFLDFLVEHPRYGWLVTCPSSSPEHGPDGENWKEVASTIAGCTMDNQIAFELLSNTRMASIILGRDTCYADTLQQVINRLPPMQIGKYNQLQEWLEDVDNPADKHRHISHAFGLYPGCQISPYRQPLLFQAVKNTLLQRGDEATGWSIGWKINLWARLQDGNHAYRIINNLFQGRTYPNLFNAHPPFQIDGNFGYTAGVAEMLMQSHDGALHLLPALPDVWSKGKVRGLVARGGFVVDMDWDGCQVNQVSVLSCLGGNLRLRSYVPLEGEGLREAHGANGNPFYQVPHVKEPLVSELIVPQYPVLYQIYEYDVITKPGQVYKFHRKK